VIEEPIEEPQLPGGTVATFTALDQLDSIRSQLVVLVDWLNQRSAFEAALKTQVAVVAVDAIAGARDADFEESFP
jgi:hypothetical protein